MSPLTPKTETPGCRQAMAPGVSQARALEKRRFGSQVAQHLASVLEKSLVDRGAARRETARRKTALRETDKASQAAALEHRRAREQLKIVRLRLTTDLM